MRARRKTENVWPTSQFAESPTHHVKAGPLFKQKLENGHTGIKERALVTHKNNNQSPPSLSSDGNLLKREPSRFDLSPATTNVTELRQGWRSAETNINRQIVRHGLNNLK